MRDLLLLVFILSASLGANGCKKGSSNSDLGDIDAGDSDLSGDGGSGMGELVPVKVSGQVIAFEDEMPLAGSVTVSTQGLIPSPTITVTGADFALDQVIPFSV